MTTTMVKNVVGTTPNNTMANRKGLDEIDKWAEFIGWQEKQHRAMTIKRKGKKQV